MKNEIRFGAPWALSVKLVTVIVLAMLAGVMLIGMTALPAGTPMFARVIMVFVPFAIGLGTLPFIVRGYVLRDGEMVIERLGWANHIPLHTVASVTADAEALRGALRLCGSGGLFGFFGWFRNRKLGVFRAYGTDPKLSVVVKLTNRTLVVTPDNPSRFVTELQSAVSREVRP